MEKIRVLNINIHNISKNELLDKLEQGFVITPNVDHLIKLQKDELFYQIYNKAEYVVLDSKILQLALKVFGTPAKEVIPGSDLFPSFYQYHKDNDKIKIFILGAAEGIAAKAMENINKKLGCERIVGAYSPSFGFEHNDSECEKIIDIINDSGANVLAIGVGAPKQEKWVYQYRSKLKNMKIFLAIGATIDFEAGNVKRAPALFQRLSLEWLYRMIKQPKRLIRRYLIDDIPIFWLLLKQRFGIYKNPFQ
jgi:exopolysaccharide biosynthesis WecB/TagA/CpsF family protein